MGPGGLCYFHHRLVHEGGWQVINAGREFRFLPPERLVMRRTRGPGYRWAARGLAVPAIEASASRTRSRTISPAGLMSFTTLHDSPAHIGA
jgi:hypothetical protein